MDFHSHPADTSLSAEARQAILLGTLLVAFGVAVLAWQHRAQLRAGIVTPRLEFMRTQRARLIDEETAGE